MFICPNSRNWYTKMNKQPEGAGLAGVLNALQLLHTIVEEACLISRTHISNN